MKILSWPEKKSKGLKSPPWWRTWWMPVGVVVQYRGRRWEKIETGAADRVWRAWTISEKGYVMSAAGNWVPMIN